MQLQLNIHVEVIALAMSKFIFINDQVITVMSSAVRLINVILSRDE